MSSQFSLGFSTELADTVIVFCINNAMSVPVKEGWNVEISRDFDKAGVKVLENGKVQFPEKGMFTAMLVYDNDFSRVQVRPANQALLLTSALKVRATVTSEATQEVFTRISDLLDPDGEIIRLLTRFSDQEVDAIQLVGNLVLSKFAEVDWEKLIAEVEDLKTRYENPVTAPEGGPGSVTN